MFSYLYRSFYDRSLFSSYIKGGRGYGFKPLFFLALTAAVVVAARVTAALFGVTATDIAALVDAIDMPETVIEDGRIVSPRDFKKTIVDEEGNTFFVIDTSGDPVKTDGLPAQGVYITNDAVTVFTRTKTTRTPFVSLLDDKNVTVNSGTLQMLGEEILKLCRQILPPVVLSFMLPILWAYYFLAAVFYGLLSYLTTWAMKTTLAWEERLRLATLSVIPAYVLNIAAFVFGASIPASLNVVLIAVFMVCFLLDGKRKDIEKTLEVAGGKNNGE